MRKLILVSSMFLVIVVAITALASIRSVGAGNPWVPTPAPSPTPGPAPDSFSQAYPELVQPLEKDQSLDQALSYDAKLAKWEKPWDTATVNTEPERITVEWHADRSYDGSYFGPGTETGPVWVITIKGQVRINEDNYQMVYDGITYTIGQKTGHLLQFATGLPVSK